MKLDWDKDTGQWNIRDIETDRLLHRVDEVRLLVPSRLVSTDGGRHGYLVADGAVEITDNMATIRSKPHG